MGLLMQQKFRTANHRTCGAAGNNYGTKAVEIRGFIVIFIIRLAEGFVLRFR
jgi:hypothetical protein